ncbi:MAG: hypothetical protein MUC79_06705 [Thiobacillaceae bacterium]|nr:hypothetical protein [Thiobacillaceae bacterium]
MRDIRDYLRRLSVAVLLCPVATAAWLGFMLAGFDIGAFLALLGDLNERYAALDSAAQQDFRLHVYAGWAVLAFGYLLITYVVSPPRFDYRLRRRNDHWVTDVVKQ